LPVWTAKAPVKTRMLETPFLTCFRSRGSRDAFDTKFGGEFSTA
jgi:hypothetical protein